MAKKIEPQHTQKLDDDDDFMLPIRGLAYGTTTDVLHGTVEYIPMPDPASRRKPGPVEHPWWIILAHPNPNKGIIGLEIHDDVTLGRASGSKDKPDLDLSLLDASDLGVSRKHALLRPTTKQLFLIDLRSTNGTKINSLPVGDGMARALKHNDTIALGDLHLTFKIVRNPTHSDWKDKSS